MTPLMGQRAKQKGFTIVELLIVIVVIGILAAISLVAYSGVQERARNAKINSDMAQLEKAVRAARISDSKLMADVTGSTSTAGSCAGKPDGTNLATLPKADGCWAAYLSALAGISSASGIDVKGLVDPYGRPYFIDENETATACSKDQLGVYTQPFVTGWGPPERRVYLPFYRSDC